MASICIGEGTTAQRAHGIEVFDNGAARQLLKE
jgi:hypothetical protein